MVGTLVRLLVLGIATLTSAVAGAQFKIVEGVYEHHPVLWHRFSLTVAKPTGKNWTVKGTHHYGETRYPLSGTLYASGKLALKPNKRNPKDKKSLYYHYEDGRFDPATGKLIFSLYLGPENLELGAENRERKAVFLCTALCTNSKYTETVWVLKKGFPKYDDAYEKGSKPFTVDASGTMTWPATSLKDGKPISQTLKFSPPKKEYRPGEEFEVFVDASGTELGAYPYVMVFIYFGWAPGGHIQIGNDKSQYGESVKWRPTGKVKFEPFDETKAAVLVGAPGLGGLRWEYEKVVRQRKPTPKPAGG